MIYTLRHILPLSLTLTRIVMAPCLLWITAMGLWGDAVLILLVSTLTDYADGALARAFDACTPLGAALDPFADKCLILAGMAGLVLQGTLPLWVLIVVAGRDFLVTYLRSYPAQSGERLVTSRLAQYKTASQFVLLICIVAREWSRSFSTSRGVEGVTHIDSLMQPLSTFLATSGVVCTGLMIGAVAALTVWSGVEYALPRLSLRVRKLCDEAIVTVCGLGYSPIAPGTVGSLAGWMAGLAWYALSPAVWSMFFVLAFGMSIAAIERTQVLRGDEDPRSIVIDEFLAMALLAALTPPTLSLQLLAFVLFRLFDVVKFGPVAYAERAPGAWGVLADDFVAAALSFVLIQLC